MNADLDLKSMNDLVGLCKRRGFVFQSSEIYGGLASCWDYGPLGVELKSNLRERWWKDMAYREDVVGIDASILMHPTVWKASGHVDGFHDPMVDCKNCKERFRGDQVTTSTCPKCGAKDSFTSMRDFNLMFKTQFGAVEDSSSQVYLRPETAQGIFVNFCNVQQSLRKRLPFGICQVGKAFRNEITPGHFIFRTREFEQMEMQYFVVPGTQKEAMEKWKEIRWQWHLDNGLRKEKLRWMPHDKDHLAHYAEEAVDVEYEFPMGWGEVEGIHSRTDFDLRQHQETSGKKMHYVDQVNGNKKYLPYVVETSVGLDRILLAVLCDVYRVEREQQQQQQKQQQQQRTVMRFLPGLAPIKVGVLPLMGKPPLEEMAQKVFKELQKYVKAEYDVAGTIGKRYRRQDEIGTPFCLTVDFESLEGKGVTVRDRDSMEQERISLDRVQEYLTKKLSL